MKTALLRLLSSLKFWTLIIGAIVTASSAALAKYGLEVSDEAVREVATWLATGFAVLLGGQALADHGKSKAEIETRHIQSGFIRLDALVFTLAAAAMIGMVACSWLKSETKAAGRAVIDCTTDRALEVAKEYAPSVELAVRSQLSDTGQIDREGLKALAKSFATDTGRCVLARVVTRLLVPTGSDTQATPLPVDTEDVAAAWDAVRADVYGGKSFALGDG